MTNIINSYLNHLFSKTDVFTILWACIIGLMLLQFCYNRYKQWQNFPPGPWGLPVLGYLPLIFSKEPLNILQSLHKKYGDVFSFGVPFNTNVVVCNSYETVLETFVKQGDKMMLPPGFSIIKWMGDFSGLFDDDEWIWKGHRRFVIRTLKDFGFGRTNLEGDIQEATSKILEGIRENANKPYDFNLIVANNAANIVNKILFNEILQMDDIKFRTIKENTSGILNNNKMPGLEAFRPMAIIGKYIPLKFLPTYHQFETMKAKIFDVLRSFVEEHEESFDANNLRDFIDVFLDKMKNAESGSKEAALFDRKHLPSMVFIMMLGGLETTWVTMAWAIKLLSINKHVQKKVQAEIDEVIGRNKMPLYSNSQNTPYINATINEILRISNQAPISFYFSCKEPITISGFNIPKDTLVLANMFALHRDPKYWENPEQFNPENFIGSNGKLKTKVESYMPFFVGKRSCPGEIFARMVTYIIFTAVFQQFSFELVEGESEKLETFKGIGGRVLYPFKAIARPRT